MSMSLNDRLSTLESSGLIRLAQAQPELEYLFRHTLFQEAAYASLLKGDRRGLHQLVGETLERLYPDRLEELAPVLARHYDEAGAGSRALDYYSLAGESAARRYANSEAVMHYSRALAIAIEVPGLESSRLQALFLARGRTLELSAQYDQAQANYQEMEALAQARGDPSLQCSALVARSLLHATVNPLFNPKLSQELAERALQFAHEIADRSSEAKIYWIMLLVNHFTRKLEKAAEFGERSMSLARQLNLQEQLAFTLNDLGRTYMGLGRLEEGRVTLEEARHIWRSLGNMPMLAENLSSSATIRMLVMEYDQALALAGEALRISQETGNLWGQSYSLEIIAYILLERGDFPDGFRSLEDAIRLGYQAGNLEAIVIASISLAYIYGRLGAFDRGIQLIRQAMENLGEPKFEALGILMGVLSVLYQWSGNVQEAEKAFEEAQKSFSHDNSVDFAIVVKFAECEFKLYRKDYTGAVSSAQRLIPLLDQAFARILHTDIVIIQSKALLALGQLEEARRLLLEEQALIKDYRSHRNLWEILGLLSQVEARLGNEEEARALSQQESQEIVTLADNFLPPDLRESFLNLPQVRAALDQGSGNQAPG